VRDATAFAGADAGPGRRLSGGLCSAPPSKEAGVPTYIMLSKLSEQGLQTLRANPDRIREVNKDVEELGARVLHQWFMLGPYDFVNIVEAPDAKTVARVSVAISARGSTELESYEAIDVSELLDLLSA
jgi:uncharacterized protein with GYD domain